jgi:type II secretory ATPase GspE/PulE/Tfp pilus assembly ATPase PilB-like protein
MPALPLQEELDRHWAAGADSVPALVDWLITAVAATGASDLHLEPRGEDLLVRWRLDGCLADAAKGTGPLRANVIQRLKVRASLLTYRTDIPQDGRIQGADGGLDMRVSIYPTVQGEKAVVRFFHKSGTAQREGGDWTLDRLGLGDADLEKLDAFLIAPQGMLLLTGPAGSGKTTTIYACLRRIVEVSQGRRQVVTIEDPVERILPGVTHTELKAAAELDYPRALKSLLRQDPEVIMIGEIRDGETAQVAVQAALTGHLILSTVHAPSAPEVLLRILHLGVEPYLAASVIGAVMDQRLVRKVCDACNVRQAFQPDANGAKPPATPQAGQAGKPDVPCPTCAGTGYKGRLLVAELLTVSGALREAVLARSDRGRLFGAAASLGWKGLWSRGMQRVAEGLTTESELRRVLASPEA